MDAWLRKFISAELRGLLMRREGPGDWDAHHCVLKDAGDNLCTCVSTCLAAGLESASSSEALSQKMICCWRHAECQGCLYYLGWLLQHMDEHLQATFVAEDHEQLGYLVDRTEDDKTKRRRVDDGVKLSVFDALAKGRACSAHSLLRAAGDDRAGYAHLWVAQVLAQELSSMTLNWARGGTFGLIPDGARFSNPGTELMMCGVWHCDSQTGAWMPPQAIGDKYVPCVVDVLVRCERIST